MPVQKFTAIILAADRGVSDPVAAATQSPCKALSPVCGTPMLIRVMQALLSSQSIDSILVVGPAPEIVTKSPELEVLFAQDTIRWINNGASPCTSAQLAIKHIDESKPTLITTADHALLSPEIIDFFCQQAVDTESDSLVGLANAEDVVQAYPEVGRTKWAFKDKQYCSCNLFAICTHRGRDLIEFWKQVEDNRKKPLRIITKLGWVTVLRFMLRQITLDQTLEQLSTKLSLKIKPILLPFPEAAIDVDTELDLKLVEKILTQKNKSG